MVKTICGFDFEQIGLVANYCLVLLDMILKLIFRFTYIRNIAFIAFDFMYYSSIFISFIFVLTLYSSFLNDFKGLFDN